MRFERSRTNIAESLDIVSTASWVAGLCAVPSTIAWIIILLIPRAEVGAHKKKSTSSTEFQGFRAFS